MLNNVIVQCLVWFCALIEINRASNFETSKVIIHKPTYSENSHFGYSVAGYKLDKDAWILIGAPLAVRERTHGQVIKSREGAVFRCRINVENSCYMLPFDKKDWNEARDHYGMYYSENKTDQLLGATLLVSDDIIMTCAPNYRYVTRMLRHDEFRYEPTGTCFTLKDKMRKLEEHSPCRNAMWGHHRQGYCQAGFSAAISKNDTSLFISGPGAWYWQGMIFSINLQNKDIRNRYPEKSGEGSNDDSYRGYSIDTGHFDDDSFEDIVVSSPRGGACKGYVEIFNSNLKLLSVLHGNQIGAYYGASIIAVDVNDDGATDLIVGSPMYKKDTENYDIGKIDVYIRDKTASGFVFKQTTIMGAKAKSRFGTSLAKLGDINDDGFNDIAVGAPYDGDDHSGIVYIYHGTSGGLNPQPSQIIKGSEYNLKSFGFSISGGLDLDGNKYPDLIVGAYKSDAAVFIRSKSVIKTYLVTQTNPKVIDFESNSNYCDKNKTRICIEFEYCVQYYGKAVPSSLRMLITLELDIDKYHNKSLIRSVFSDTRNNFFAQNYTFKSNQKKCFNQLISIKKNIRDKLVPIKTRVNLTLPNYDTEWELMPMFKSQEDSSKVHEIRFLRNCGSDDICVPNLKVSASTLSKKYVFGSQFNIDLNIRIENAKEDAFEAQCHIVLPEGVDFVKAFMNQHSLPHQQSSLPCYQNKMSNETKLICDIGNPMPGGSSKTFTIRVAPQNIPLNQEVLRFNISATSSNKEDKSTISDNEHQVYVLLEAVPGIALVGKKYQEQVIYDTKLAELKYVIENETDIGPEIIHEYKVINKGPSQFLKSELLIAWQREIKNAQKSSPFMYLMDTPYTEGPISCFTQELTVNPFNLTRLGEDKLKNPSKYYRINKELERMKRYLNYENKINIFDFIPSSIYLNQHKNKNSFLNFGEHIECSSGMIKQSNAMYESSSSKRKYLTMLKSELYDQYCSSLHCYVGPLGRDESAIIRLRFRLWSRSLLYNPDIYKIKTYAMSAVTEIPYSKINLNLDQFHNSVKIETIAYPKERKQIFPNIDLRIVLLSVIGGIILLILLIIVLWCCGFFKRFEPNNEESKKSDLLTTDEEISTCNDVIDVSKECSKLDSEIRPTENVNLLAPLSPVSTYKLAPTNKAAVANGGQQKLIANNDDEIYGFTPLNSGELSTFQSSLKAASSQSTFGMNANGANNKFCNPMYSYYPDSTSSKCSDKMFINVNNYDTNGQLIKSSAKLKQPLIEPVNCNDIYTSKLPPVPKRNSRSTIQNSSSNNQPMSLSKPTTSVLLSASSSSAATDNTSLISSVNLSTISSTNLLKPYKK